MNDDNTSWGKSNAYYLTDVITKERVIRQLNIGIKISLYLNVALIAIFTFGLMVGLFSVFTDEYVIVDDATALFCIY